MNNQELSANLRYMEEINELEEKAKKLLKSADFFVEEQTTPDYGGYYEKGTIRTVEEAIHKYTQKVDYNIECELYASRQIYGEVIKLLKIRYDEDGEEVAGEGENVGYSRLMKAIEEVGRSL